MVKLTAAPTWIIVEPEKEELKTSNGIYLPEKEKIPTKGIVLSVGKEIKQIKEGDSVYFKRWESNEVVWEGTKLLIMKEENILATV